MQGYSSEQAGRDRQSPIQDTDLEQVHHEVYALLEENLMKLVLAGMDNQRLGRQLNESRMEITRLKDITKVSSQNQPILVTNNQQIVSLEREITDLKRKLYEQQNNQNRPLENADQFVRTDLQRAMTDNAILQTKLVQLEGDKAILISQIQT